MSMQIVEKGDSKGTSETYLARKDREIELLADAPTGAPMERCHWVFLLISGIALPVLILLWGWT